ncbi:MAG: carbohydrate porin, partial [Haloferula sp.]
MNRNPFALTATLALAPFLISAEDELDPAIAAALRKEIDSIRQDYEGRITELENRIKELEAKPAPTPAPTPAPPTRRSTPSPSNVQTDDTTDEDMSAASNREALKAFDSVKESFRGDTETRQYRPRPTDNEALADRIEQVLEGYLDISGYFRAGYGRSDEGGPLRAFGLPGVAKYRLGNEAENYGELLFSKTFFTPGSFSLYDPGQDAIQGVVSQWNLRLAYFNPYDNYGSGADTTFTVPEVWASFANIIPGDPDAKVWAGSRFYRRHDIHINDFYFWDMSGGGAGIEDLSCGPGKFAFAWIGDGSESAIYSGIGTVDPLNVAGFSKTNFDLRYYDWPFLGGKGEVGLTYSIADSGFDSTGRKAEDSEGFALTLIRTNEGFLDEHSVHKTSLAVGTGPAKTFTSGFDTFSDPTGTYIRPDPNESWRLRATDHWVVKPWECVSLGTALVYQYTDFGDNLPEQHWVSAGLRPIWHLNEWASIAFEGGFDWISNSPNGSNGSLGKITVAPQISLGN